MGWFAPMTDGVITLRAPGPDGVAAIVAGRDDEFHRWMGPGSDDPAPTACIVVAGEVVGWVDFDPEPAWLKPGEVNVGYAVLPGHRGNGYATRAVRLLLRHLTSGTEYRTAVLVVDRGNERSLAVARRLDLEPGRDDGQEIRFEVDVGRCLPPNPRVLSWDGCVNVRDLGGYRTGDGGATRFGAVVRSDNPAYLSSRGWEALQDYGIRTVVALRTVGAADDEPVADNVPRDIALVRVVVEDVTDDEFVEQQVTNGLWGTPLYFADALERWPARAAAAVRAVARAAPGGVVISCGRGCDRTGFLAILLLHLVGVAPADIAADYSLSTEQMPARDPAYPDELMQALARHGTSVEEAVAAFVARPIVGILRRGVLTDADLGALRGRLVTSVLAPGDPEPASTRR